MKKESGLFNFRLLLLFVLFGVIIISCQAPPDSRAGWHQLPAILNQIVAPEFPNQEFVIFDFGAQGDGVTDCTEAFRKAINACHVAGGGRVRIPADVFLTGAIHLKSNVNLHIEKGATVLFHQDINKYLPVVFTRFEGVELMNFSPFIYAHNQENIAISGEGILDGNSDSTAWWPWAGKTLYGWKEGMPCQRQDRDSLFEMAEKGIAVEQRIFGNNHYLRPKFIQFYQCKNILIEGNLLNHVTDLHLEDVTINGI
ncbi:MAG: glycosyl hydrolase family 28-related protein [candidate division KSB1 bacterium]|nr:glycosyl hydrolase family 28-related protein [candidate division KSB1 bacterium]